MEVHHHPEVEKKGFKEYLLEGLMIFLAVTMGFFAETIREDISDNSKGKEYIRSYVHDLRADTASFSILKAFDDKKSDALNKLSSCYDTLQKDSKSSGCLVPLLVNSMSNRAFNFVDGTLEQLKNAGGFRLLKKADRDTIVAFDHEVRNYIDFQSTVFQQRQNILREVFVKLVDFKTAEKMRADSLTTFKTPVLFSSDKALLNEFFNDLELYRRVIKTQDNKIAGFKKRATDLIKHFDHKYNLSDD
jgi:hypothetical protein